MSITYDDFAKLELKVGTVLECKPSADNEKQLLTQLDLGSEKRSLALGLGPDYPAERLLGKQVVAVANLNRPLPAAPPAPPAADPAAPPAPAPNFPVAHLSAVDLGKVEFRIADVLECKAHPNADKLLVLQIALGEEKRQICAGLRAYYQPEQLAGRKIVVVANLDARKMRGEISQGMLLAATDGASGRVIALGLDEPVTSGSPVATAEGVFVAVDAASGRRSIIFPIEPVAAGSGVK